MSKRAKLVNLFSATGILPWLAARPRWNGVVVLTYHRIGNAEESMLDRNVFSATADEFDRQVALLKRESDIVRPDDVPELIKKPGRHVMITFDDGYRDNFDLAFPILKAHGVPATFFLCTGFLDHQVMSWWDEIAWLIRSSPLPEISLAPWSSSPIRTGRRDVEQSIQAVLTRYKELPTQCAQEMLASIRSLSGSPPLDAEVTRTLWMTWEMVREMAAAGMVIGGHTVNHPLLGRLDAAAQRAEIASGQRRITAELGHPARAFAYPVGSADSFDAATKAAVASAGFKTAFSFHGGYARSSTWDPFNIPRTYIATGTCDHTIRAIMALPQLFISPIRLPSANFAAAGALSAKIAEASELCPI